MKLEISRSVVDAIMLAADRADREEICGLLFGEDGRIDRFKLCDNVAADSRSTFEIDPAQLIAAHRAERLGEQFIAGCFHSHPRGSTEPSPADATAAAPNGWVWLIVGGSHVGVWRAVEHGARHGRFETVDWELV